MMAIRIANQYDAVSAAGAAEIGQKKSLEVNEMSQDLVYLIFTCRRSGRKPAERNFCGSSHCGSQRVARDVKLLTPLTQIDIGRALTTTTTTSTAMMMMMMMLLPPAS